jgi:hypothetical protein
MITPEDLRRRIREHPFRPFRLRLTDGRHFDILDPTWHLALEPIFIVGLPPEDDPKSRFAGERSEWVPYKIIDKIEPLPLSTAAG